MRIIDRQTVRRIDEVLPPYRRRCESLWIIPTKSCETVSRLSFFIFLCINQVWNTRRQGGGYPPERYSRRFDRTLTYNCVVAAGIANLHLYTTAVPRDWLAHRRTPKSKNKNKNRNGRIKKKMPKNRTSSHRNTHTLTHTYSEPDRAHRLTTTESDTHTRSSAKNAAAAPVTAISRPPVGTLARRTCAEN